MTNKSPVFFLSVLLLPFSAFSQKAYENIYYSGKTKDMRIKLAVADGYIGASELRTTDLKTKKTSRFLPENGYVKEYRKLKFYHYSPSGKTFGDYFIIDGMAEYFDNTPARIYGKYYRNGTVSKLISFELN
jgi:hypothetical protein